MSDNFIIDKLKERTTGKILYPISILEALKASEDENSKNLKQILETNGFPLDYELYGYAVCLGNANPQTRIHYFEMAKGKRPAFWNYVNGYFDYGDWSHAFFIRNCFPCMVKYDGTMDYKLDPENYNLKEDGTASDAKFLDAVITCPAKDLYLSVYNVDGYIAIYLYLAIVPSALVCMYALKSESN